jgi:hypothetical protein
VLLLGLKRPVVAMFWDTVEYCQLCVAGVRVYSHFFWEAHHGLFRLASSNYL